MREPVGMLPVIAEEVGGDGVADGDELNMGDTTGPEWDVGSMLVMQRGLVAASWVAGRRRVTREGTEREGRECRRKGDGGIEVEHRDGGDGCGYLRRQLAALAHWG